jgi:hypothetical protein
MFGKYNGFVSKARVSACMYFLVIQRIITGFHFRCDAWVECIERGIFINNGGLKVA